MARIKARSDQTYLCGDCFEQTTNMKKCRHCDSTNVFPIDLGMVEIVQILNKKGYKTIMCCEGHPTIDGKTSHVFPHLIFSKKYPSLELLGGKWDFCANMWRLSWGNYSEPNMRGLDALEAYKVKLLDTLKEKVAELPDATE